MVDIESESMYVVFVYQKIYYGTLSHQTMAFAMLHDPKNQNCR